MCRTFHNKGVLTPLPPPAQYRMHVMCEDSLGKQCSPGSVSSVLDQLSGIPSPLPPPPPVWLPAGGDQAVADFYVISNCTFSFHLLLLLPAPEHKSQPLISNTLAHVSREHAGRVAHMRASPTSPPLYLPHTCCATFSTSYTHAAAPSLPLTHMLLHLLCLLHTCCFVFSTSYTRAALPSIPLNHLLHHLLHFLHTCATTSLPLKHILFNTSSPNGKRYHPTIFA